MNGPQCSTHPCPRCGRLLHHEGELEIAGEVIPVFQCDHCEIDSEIFGVPVRVALTFRVDASGRVFNPNCPEGPSLN